MKTEVNPLVYWAALGVVIVGLVGFWFFRMRTPAGFETTGSEKQIEQVQKTGKFYTPPAGVPGVSGTPGAGGAAPGGMPMGMPPGMPAANPGGQPAPMPGR